MARHDGELKAVEEIGFDEVFRSTGLSRAEDRQRRAAIACCFSASDGWQEAIKLLGGAFVAGQPAAKARLTRGKSD